MLASICIILTAFSLNRKAILGATLFASVFTGSQYLILGQISTTFLVSVSLIYSVLLMMETQLPMVRTHAFTAFVLLVQTGGYFIINGLSVDWSLLALAGTLIGTVALWFHNPLKLKVALLVMGFIWLAFQLVSGAYGQLPGEIVFLTGVTASIIMLVKAKRKGIPVEDVQELPMLLKEKFFSKKELALA